MYFFASKKHQSKIINKDAKGCISKYIDSATYAGEVIRVNTSKVKTIFSFLLINLDKSVDIKIIKAKKADRI